MTKPEHVSKTIAPFDEEIRRCEIDLRVGGRYHFDLVTKDGAACSFQGTYSEVEPPVRTVATWSFGGWPGVEAVESLDLREDAGVTTLTWKLAFADKAGRARMTKYDGLIANLDKVEELLRRIA